MLFHWEQCPRHNWTQLDTCPYGAVGLFEVTWPDAEKAERYGLFHGWDFPPSTTFLAVCYAYAHVPYFILMSCVIAFVLKRGTKELSVLIFLGFTCLSAELLVVHTKFLPEDVQRRPEQSCLTTCGMPSTKTAIAVGCWMLRFLDNLTRSRPSFLPSGQRRPSQMTGIATSSSLLTRITIVLFEVFSVGVPLASWDEVVGDMHVAFLAFWMFLVLPVPLAIVQLKDNTMQQAFYGATAGFFLAIVWALVMRILQHRYNSHLGSTKLLFLRHNLALPCFMAERRCAEGNKTALARRPSLAASWVGGTLAQSTRAREELQWYLEQTSRRRKFLRALGLEENAYLQDRASRLEELIRGLAPKRHTEVAAEDAREIPQSKEILQSPSSSTPLTNSRSQETELAGSTAKPAGRAKAAPIPMAPARSSSSESGTSGMSMSWGVTYADRDKSPAMIAQRSVRL